MQIETDRLLLRSMTIDDTGALLEIFTDPNVMVSFGGGRFSRTQMEGWVLRNLAHQEKFGYGLFSIILKSENQLIGDCGLERMEISGDREVELGYDIHSEYWGRGYATEAAIVVRDLAWREIRLSRLISLIRPSNLASIRVSEKVGMTKEREIVRSNELYFIYSISSGRA